MKIKYCAQKGFLIWIIGLLILTSFSTKIFQPVNMSVIETNKSDNIEELAQFDDNYGIYRDITGEGNLLVVLTYDKVYFFDITNRSKLVMLKELTIESYSFNEIAIKNNFLFVAGFSIFQSYNITDLDNIQLLDSIDTGASGDDLQIIDNLAYMTLLPNNLTIIDVADPENLEQVANFEVTNGINYYSIEENYLYSKNDVGYLVVTNITDYENPQMLTSYWNGTENYQELEIRDGYLYVTEELTHRLLIFNCTNPSSMDFLSDCDFCRGSRLALEENFVYVLNSRDLIIVNITDLTTPIKISDKNLFDPFLNFELYNKDSFLYVVEGTALKIINCLDIYEPQEDYYLKKGGISTSLILKDETIFVADYEDGIEIFELNTTNYKLNKTSFFREQTELGVYLDYYYTDLLMDGDILYASTNTEIITVFRVLENNTLLKTGECSSEFYSIDQIVMNERFIFGRPYESLGINIFDRRNKYNPTNYEYYFDSTKHYTFELAGNILFTLCYSELIEKLRILNVNNPQEIQLIYEEPITGVGELSGDLYIHEDFLYVMTDQKMMTYNIKNPAVPEKISEYQKEGTTFYKILTCTDNYIVIREQEGIYILDISDKENPTEVAHYFDGGQGYEAIAIENTLYIADGLDNLEILQTTFSLESKESNLLLYILLPIGIVSLLGIVVVTIFILKKKGNARKKLEE